MKLTLLDNFPRSIGHPRQDCTVFNAEQRDAYILKYRKKCDLYMSVYKFTGVNENNELDRDTAYIDKVFFDFDDTWLSDIVKLRNWCEKYDIIRRCHVSGNGSQGFIYVKPTIMNKHEAIGNFQRWLDQTLGTHNDPKVIGDTSRIFRIPNTYNFTGRRFCIAVPDEMLVKENLTEDYLRRFQTKRQYFNPWAGHKLLDLSKWDTNEDLYVKETVDTIKMNDVDPNIQIEYPEFPACIQQIMSTPVIDDTLKFNLIVFLKDQTLTPAPFDAREIISICKKIWHPAEYEHYFGNGKGVLKRRHSGHHGVKFKTAMTRDYFVPNCDEFRAYNMCPKNCGKINPAHNRDD